ncbi:MAG TPA: polysaccharide deacetylase family protein [Halomicronema sp.]
MNKAILLSFDVEEFDIPEEYGQKIEDFEKFQVSLEGLKGVLAILEKLDIKATFFITANFAMTYPSLVIKMAEKYEIASHGFYHSSFEIEDLKKSRKVLSEISGQKILGFRMARLKPLDDNYIEEAGYKYNSSMNPTYLPGRYNNFFKPRTAYYSNTLLNIPVSVTPIIRFPLFWLSFKNFPLFLIKLASKFTLNNDRYLSLYYHPWEFANISKYPLPIYVKKLDGEAMLSRLETYLMWLKTQGKFIGFSEFYNEFKK